MAFCESTRGPQRAVVQLGQQLAAPHLVANLHGDLDDASVALGGDVGLLFGDQRAGGGEGLRIYGETAAKLGAVAAGAAGAGDVDAGAALACTAGWASQPASDSSQCRGRLPIVRDELHARFENS